MTDDLLLAKWQTEFKKGFSKPLILLALAEIERSYAFLLTKKILELTNGEISIAGSNIYPMLSTLEKENLIKGHSDKSNKRKFYKLTNRGREFLKQVQKSIKDFNEIILELINKNEGAV